MEVQETMIICNKIEGILVEICTSASQHLRTSTCPTDTSRQRMLASIWDPETTSVNQDRLICAREHGPSLSAFLKGFTGGRVAGDQAQGDSKTGGLVLANVLSARCLFFGNVSLLSTWQLFRSQADMRNAMEEWEQKNGRPAVGNGAVYGSYPMPASKSKKQTDSLDVFWGKAREDWNELRLLGPTGWKDLYGIVKKLPLCGHLLASLVTSDMARLGWVHLPEPSDWNKLMGSGSVKGLRSLVPEWGSSKANEVAEWAYERLAGRLSEQDRQVLTYDRVFFEHLLCKVGRFVAMEKKWV